MAIDPVKDHKLSAANSGADLGLKCIKKKTVSKTPCVEVVRKPTKQCSSVSGQKVISNKRHMSKRKRVNDKKVVCKSNINKCNLEVDSSLVTKQETTVNKLPSRNHSKGENPVLGKNIRKRSIEKPSSMVVFEPDVPLKKWNTSEIKLVKAEKSLPLPNVKATSTTEMVSSSISKHKLPLKDLGMKEAKHISKVKCIPRTNFKNKPTNVIYTCQDKQTSVPSNSLTEVSTATLETREFNYIMIVGDNPEMWNSEDDDDDILNAASPTSEQFDEEFGVQTKPPTIQTEQSDEQSYLEPEILFEEPNVQVDIPPPQHKFINELGVTLLQCQICDLQCDSEAIFNKHKNKAEFVCRVCEAPFCTHGELETHFIQHTYQCAECKQIFYHVRDILDHRMYSGCKKLYSCEICFKTHNKRLALERHKYTHLNKEKETHPCEICGLRLATRNLLEMHYVEVHSLAENQCPICKKITKDKHYLRSHWRAVHCEDPSICPKCGKVCKNPKLLQHHIAATHSDKKKNASCDVCGKCFKTKSMVDKHKTYAHSEATKCNICDKRFKRDKLESHVEKDHGQSFKHCCSICSKEFTLKKTLAAHIQKIHLKVKPYECHICKERFKGHYELWVHKRVHYRVASYSCEKCGNSFKLKESFDKHIKKCKGGD